MDELVKHSYVSYFAEPFLLFLSPYVLPLVSMRLSFQALAKWHSTRTPLSTAFTL